MKTIENCEKHEKTNLVCLYLDFCTEKHFKEVAVHQSEKRNSVCRNTLAVQNIYR